MKDSINFITQNISSGCETLEGHSDIWMWISIVELIIILLLILRLFGRQKTSIDKKLKAESLSQSVDFGNIIKSSFHATELYDKLKVKCHPDRFVSDPVLNKKADLLFQEITQNKSNLKRLEELKREAIEVLNIKL